MIRPINLPEIRNTREEELSKKDLEVIKKLSSADTTEAWKKLKMAVFIRYIQKIAEDKEIMKEFREKLKYKEGLVVNMNEVFTKEEINNYLKDLIKKKQEAFNEATKSTKSKGLEFNIIDQEHFKTVSGEPSGGFYRPQENKLFISDNWNNAMKVTILEHEMTHYYQKLITDDLEFAKSINLGKDFENFEYGRDNTKSYNVNYYQASISERDAKESEERAMRGIADLTKRVIVPKKEVSKDTLGYVAISQPNSFLPRSEDPFTVADKVAAEARNELEFSKNMEKYIKKILSREDKEEFKKILEKYEDFQRLSPEFGERMQRNILDALGEQLNQLKIKNKKLDLFIYENKPPLTKESYRIVKRKSNPNLGRELPTVPKEEGPEVEDTKL